MEIVLLKLTAAQVQTDMDLHVLVLDIHIQMDVMIAAVVANQDADVANQDADVANQHVANQHVANQDADVANHHHADVANQDADVANQDADVANHAVATMVMVIIMVTDQFYVFLLKIPLTMVI